jgi:hypothetical protein
LNPHAGPFGNDGLHDFDGPWGAMPFLWQGAFRNIPAFLVGKVCETEAEVLVKANLGTLSEAALKSAREAGLKEQL